MKNVHVVAHTHWDREWYFTIEDSNAMLVEHMDYLIDYLEDNPSFPYFVFDGQVSVINSYLKYRPENKKRLTDLIKANRIHIGPWFTQADSMNPKIESIIRNLMYGIKLAKEYGSQMNIGYLPDAFGQNAYLPSIFNDCEIDYSVLQRGISSEQASKGVNFNWKSPNKKIIKSNYIFFGYGPGKFLSSENEYLQEKLLPILDKLQDLSKDEDILLPSGGDQALIRTHFPQVCKEINQQVNNYNLELSTYEKFMQSIDFKTKQVIEGELYTPQKSRIHRTIHSQRMDLKILNTNIERKVVEILEPLFSIASKLKLRTNQKMLDEIWELLFDVHAHDSIGGCNSDATNKNIIARLNSISYLVDNQINLLKKKIALNVAGETQIMIFNFSTTSVKKMTVKIYTRNSKFTISKDNKLLDYHILKQDEISGGTKIEVTAAGERQVKLPSYFETQVELKLSNLFIGYQILDINEDVNTQVINTYQAIDTNEIKTKYYTLNFNKSLKISTDSREVILGFESQSDVGDSYDFAYLEDQNPLIYTEYTNYNIQEHATNYLISINYELVTHNLELLEIETIIKLDKEEDTFKITHNFKNTTQKHRLRAIFKTDITSQSNYADSGFGIVKRDNVDQYINNYKELNFVEKPLAVYPFERFMKIEDLTVYHSEVKEYEVLDNYLALTLFRSVDVLGRDDLSTRPNRASGINNVVVYTPDALLIDHQFSITYYLSLHQTNAYHLYDRVASNYDYYQLQNLNVFDNRVDRFELPSKDIKLEKEFKLAQFNDKLILSSITVYNNKINYRLFNPSEESISIEITSDMYFSNLLSNKITTESKYNLQVKDYITICEEL